MHFLLLLLAVPLAQCQCQCRPKAQCIGQFATLADAAETVCLLTQGGEGFCCEDVFNLPADLSVRSARPVIRRKLKKPTDVSSSNIINSLNRNRTTQEERKTEVDEETKGQNLFNKARPEDKDLQDASRKLFYLMQDLEGIRTRTANGSLDSENTIDDIFD